MGSGRGNEADDHPGAMTPRDQLRSQSSTQKKLLKKSSEQPTEEGSTPSFCALFVGPPVVRLLLAELLPLALCSPASCPWPRSPRHQVSLAFSSEAVHCHWPPILRPRLVLGLKLPQPPALGLVLRRSPQSSTNGPSFV